MKKGAFLGAVYSLMGIWPALAADLPPTPRQIRTMPALIPVTGCGTYFGINTSGAAGAVSGSPVPGASIVMGELGAHLGYTCTTDAVGGFWFLEGNFDWTNLNGATQGLSLSGPIDLFQRVGYGTPAIGQMLSVIPGLGSISTPSLPVLPPGVTAGPAVPYLYLGVHEQDVGAQFVNPNTGAVFNSNRVWEISPELGLGFWNRLSNQVVVDVSAGYQVRSTGVCIGLPSGQCPGMGNMWRARVGFNF